MVLATPIERTGGAGGMQGTARLVRQSLGSTLVTIVFSITSGTVRSVHTCLYIALIFALAAGVFSIGRRTNRKAVVR